MDRNSSLISNALFYPIFGYLPGEFSPGAPTAPQLSKDAVMGYLLADHGSVRPCSAAVLGPQPIPVNPHVGVCGDGKNGCTPSGTLGGTRGAGSGPFSSIEKTTPAARLGTMNRIKVSNQVMTKKPLPAKLVLFLGVTAFLLHPALHVAQQVEGGASLKSYVGTWKGTCADGAEFLVLKLSQSGNELAGTVSIANMNGANGRCTAVIDPPTEEHAMKIHDAQQRQKALAFKGAGQAAFEMSVAGDDEATLKFLGTPVENNPWKLKRTK